MKQKSYLDLLIKEILKQKNLDTEKEVFSIQSAHKNPKQIQSWMKSVEEIQSKKVAPSVFYQKRMPDIDQLMQPWDSSFDKIMQNGPLKDSSIPIKTELLSQIACNIFDIPVHKEDPNKKSMIESLHVLFSLYASFNQNDHFNTQTHPNQNAPNINRIEFG